MAEHKRCSWAIGDAMVQYHDTEWGRPQHDDNTLYEFLVLEGAQAGLSWNTILEKRDGYRAVFDGFDPHVVATYDDKKIQDVLQDSRIVRNSLKVKSAVNNAIKFCDIQKEYGSFDKYIWDMVGPPTKNSFRTAQEIPPQTFASKLMSKKLKQDGFTFVGPIICYAFMQAVGMVNDHTTDCFLHNVV